MASASDAVIGSRVRIWWAEEKAWFEGTVSSATSRSRGTCISYDDGQSMYEKLPDEKWELLGAPHGKKRRERPASDAAPPRGRATRVKVEAERPSFVADDDFIRASVEFSVVMAERSRARFVERADVAGQKCYYFRELDRHSMYYVRARLALLWHMRHASKHDVYRPWVEVPADAYRVDAGRLNDIESEAVVLASFVFRLFNRMETFVRWAVLARHVSRTADFATAAVRHWLAALDKLSDEDEVVIARAGRTHLDGVVPAAALPAAVTRQTLVGFLNCADALHSRGIKAFTGQHQVPRGHCHVDTATAPSPAHPRTLTYCSLLLSCRHSSGGLYTSRGA